MPINIMITAIGSRHELVWAGRLGLGMAIRCSLVAYRVEARLESKPTMAYF